MSWEKLVGYAYAHRDAIDGFNEFCIGFTAMGASSLAVFAMESSNYYGVQYSIGSMVLVGVLMGYSLHGAYLFLVEGAAEKVVNDFVNSYGIEPVDFGVRK